MSDAGRCCYARDSKLLPARQSLSTRLSPPRVSPVAFCVAHRCQCGHRLDQRIQQRGCTRQDCCQGRHARVLVVWKCAMATSPRRDWDTCRRAIDLLRDEASAHVPLRMCTIRSSATQSSSNGLLARGGWRRTRILTLGCTSRPGHNVYKMASKAAFDSCSFKGASQIAGGAKSGVKYTVQGTASEYFACQARLPATVFLCPG